MQKSKDTKIPQHRKNYCEYTGIQGTRDPQLQKKAGYYIVP